MTTRPKANQRAAIRNSLCQEGESPAYQFRIGSCQAIADSVRRSPGRGKPRARTAILAPT